MKCCISFRLFAHWLLHGPRRVLYILSAQTSWVRDVACLCPAAKPFFVCMAFTVFCASFLTGKLYYLPIIISRCQLYFTEICATTRQSALKGKLPLYLYCSVRRIGTDTILLLKKKSTLATSREHCPTARRPRK